MVKKLSFLLDQGLPQTAAIILRNQGYNVSHVSEINLFNATDREIMEYAQEHHRIIITLDADFHTLSTISKSVCPSIIRLRIEGLKGEALAKIILAVLQKVSPELEQGALVTVMPHAIRTRRLPIISKKKL